MKIILIYLLLTTPLLLLGCTSKEIPDEKIKTMIEEPVSKEISLNGGYTETSIDSTKVKESFIFLKKQLVDSYPEILNIKVFRAEIQIVAGWKMKLFCEYNIANISDINLLQAIIYNDLDQNKTFEGLNFEQ